MILPNEESTILNRFPLVFASVPEKSFNLDTFLFDRLEETDGIVLTPFEKNIEFWRQLWRVVERSDILVQIVDARQPLLYYCSDLESYAREVDPNKICLVLVNKADFLTPEQRQLTESWKGSPQPPVFEEDFGRIAGRGRASNGIRAIFWSATLAATAAHPVTDPDSLAKQQFDGDSLTDSGLQELQVDDASSDSSESTAKNGSSTEEEEEESDGDPPASFSPLEGASKDNEAVHSYESQAGGKNKVSTSERFVVYRHVFLPPYSYWVVFIGILCAV
ncbi:hypothetical protein X801_07659 [Opisthorchis viverrini]|uniref:G domain-containing protein n=1 Tax=Opisthorchis viverrini TaxID=6198 RepID=A0A1S8WPX1_OPIVI|nr:hypothetical protein X801_07659 [Opisthorchis viverrini]